MLVFVDVGWSAEIDSVDGVHERIERCPEILKVLRGEAVSGVGRVAQNYRTVGDCDDASRPDVGVRTSRRGVCIEIHQVADLGNGNRQTEATSVLLPGNPGPWNQRCQFDQRPLS